MFWTKLPELIPKCSLWLTKGMIYQKTHYPLSHSSGLWARVSTMSFIWISMMKILKNIFPEKQNLMHFKSSIFSDKFFKVFWFFTKLESFIGISSLQILWFILKLMDQSRQNLLISVNPLMYLLISKVLKFLDFPLNMPPYNALTHANKVSIPKKLIYGR